MKKMKNLILMAAAILMLASCGPEDRRDEVRNRAVKAREEVVKMGDCYSCYSRGGVMLLRLYHQNYSAKDAIVEFDFDKIHGQEYLLRQIDNLINFAEHNSVNNSSGGFRVWNPETGNEGGFDFYVPQ